MITSRGGGVEGVDKGVQGATSYEIAGRKKERTKKKEEIGGEGV